MRTEESDIDKRLIVALDVPTHEDALDLVKELDNVSFFKVGLHLLLGGCILSLIEQMQDTRAGEGGVFIDLKLSGDVPNTIAHFIGRCIPLGVQFLTLDVPAVASKTIETISAAREARNGNSSPRLLMVPLYSSLDAEDLRAHGAGQPSDPSEYIVQRGRELRGYGCDGLIVSGEAIEACRDAFPDMCIVSPGIRPKGWSNEDHKRYTTPTEAIRFGANYLVVGRPILNAANRRQAAQCIIDEMARA
jgi:orotidine-5'-phosphate decarboxylase